MRKWLVLVLVAYGMFILVTTIHQDHAKSMDGEMEQRKEAKQPPRYQAPNFSLSQLDGGEVSLKDYRGRVVLLNMWASWCGPCQKEAPDLVQLNKRLSPRGLVVLGVNMTSQETSIQNVKHFVHHFHLSFPILLDRKGKVMNSYGVRVLPTSFLIGKDGGVIRQFRGPVSMIEVKKVLEQNGLLN